MPMDDTVADHYRHGDLASAILTGLAAAGKDLATLSLEDLAPIDEFHIRGREATLELGQGMGLVRGMRVLDVGSGLGGPSRHLASRYACSMIGLDLSREYSTVAALLARCVGLADRVSYLQASALALPFADAGFDAVLTQHVAMNIADKAALYAEIRRVLRPGGTFGLYDVLQGEGGDVLYPTPWARQRSASFLITGGELRRLLEAAGFEILSWRDTTAAGRAWLAALRRQTGTGGPPPLGPHLLFRDFPAMARNMRRNLNDGRIAPTEVICRRAQRRQQRRSDPPSDAPQRGCSTGATAARRAGRQHKMVSATARLRNQVAKQGVWQCSTRAENRCRLQQ